MQTHDAAYYASFHCYPVYVMQLDTAYRGTAKGVYIFYAIIPPKIRPSKLNCLYTDISH